MDTRVFSIKFLPPFFIISTNRRKMKRTRDSLTGGTGDVNPQLMTFATLRANGANAFASASIPMPISRLNQRAGKVTVVECLKVFFDMPAPGGLFVNTGDPGLPVTINAYAQLSTSNVNIIDSSLPTVFAFADVDYRGQITAPGESEPNWAWAFAVETAKAMDLTDGAGHGILIATDHIYFTAQTFGYVGIAPFNAKMLYRFKDVSLQEYIGIVQSQQQQSPS